MLANQPEKRLCHRSCRFVLESFYFWPFAKEACASGYVFISSFCSWKGTNQIYPYSMLNLVSDWDWMQVLQACTMTHTVSGAHFGRDKMVKIEEQYYWVGIITDVLNVTDL